MGRSSQQIDVYLEVGKKRTLAGAVDWPGWCRIGRDESTALQALFDYGPRYAQVLHETRLGFQTPAERTAFAVVERLAGTATTDFGVPVLSPAGDTRPVDDAELARFQALLQACWHAFDAAATAAAGKELRKGPRGGGRDVEGITRHVLGSDAGYLAHIGGKPAPGDGPPLDEDKARLRQAILQGLAAAAHGEVPAPGPRDRVRWTPRYFVRRSAWHVLDHAWEIEDRSK